MHRLMPKPTARWALTSSGCNYHCYGPLPRLPLQRHVNLFSSSLSEDENSDDGPFPSCTKNDETKFHIEDHGHRNRNLNDYHQRGYGKIVALASQPSPSSPVSTYLTDLHHSSPMRLVPSRRSHPTQRKQEKYRAALLHLSSYGGGLVPGDSLHLDIDVRGHGAVVCILTQGGQRIYRPGEQFRHHGRFNYDEAAAASFQRSEEKELPSKLCQSTVQCTVEPGGTLFYLPDPTVPYYQSSFQERRKFYCQYSPESTVANDASSGCMSRIGENMQSMGSIVAVDWYSSGRFLSTGMEEERWAFDYLSTRTSLFVEEHGQTDTPLHRKRPILIESLVLDNKGSSPKSSTSRTSASIALGQDFDAMATVLLHGPTSLPVAERLKLVSLELAGLCTRTRSRESVDEQDNVANRNDSDEQHRESEELKKLLDSLGGKVVLSVTPVNHERTRNQQHKFEKEPLTHMVRILAKSNEDIYRILHHSLKPCACYLGGLEPYSDRIFSSKTVSRDMMPKENLNTSMINDQQRREHKMQSEQSQGRHDLDSLARQLIFGKNQSKAGYDNDAWFRLCLLSDSSLPVGSFAHSLGTEAASQLLFTSGVSRSTSDCALGALSDFVHSVSRSNARFSAPLVLAGYSLLAPTLILREGSCSSRALNVRNIHKLWMDIDAHADTYLVCNEPGRRASMDQGLGLVRLTAVFSETQNSEVLELWEMIRQSIDFRNTSREIGMSDSSTPTSLANGHAAPIYGILSASLGISPIDACRVFAFGAARDCVSAAVRLNLFGPMTGLSVLDGVGRGAVEMGLKEGLADMLRSSQRSKSSRGYTTGDTQLDEWLQSVATCAPLMDTVQPLHDLLSVRLFRT
ncbi:hypothetical protein ACHAWF_007181 [Thalassiosira exigua]